MVKVRIIPCLDVKNGRVVKGINFVDLIDAGDPVEQAKHYSENGADEICFLDITASNENRDTIYDVVKKTSRKCFELYLNLCFQHKMIYQILYLLGYYFLVFLIYINPCN